MKKIALILGLVILNQGIHSQENTVDKLKKFTLHVNPWNGEFYGVNSTSGWGWKTEFFFKRAFSFDFAYRNGKYSDQSKNNLPSNPSFTAGEGFKSYVGVEPMLTFHVKKRKTTKNLKVRLNMTSVVSGGYKITTETYKMVKGDVLTINGIRMGVSSVSTTYLLNNSNMSHFDVNYSPIIGAYNYKTETFTPGMLIDSVAMTGGYAKFNSTSFSIGFSRKKITNTVIGDSKYGKKGNNFTTCVYGDLFLGLGSFDRVVTSKNNGLQITDKLKQSGGWRLGFSYKKTNGYGISYSAEMGTRSGFKGPNLARFYMQATVGFSLITPWKRK
ncbi:MAG: hypothetical protein ACK5B9_11170 [Flavobacteriia bacterium]|jgi:hypothetical protein